MYGIEDYSTGAPVEESPFSKIFADVMKKAIPAMRYYPDPGCQESSEDK